MIYITNVLNSLANARKMIAEVMERIEEDYPDELLVIADQENLFCYEHDVQNILNLYSAYEAFVNCSLGMIDDPMANNPIAELVELTSLSYSSKEVDFVYLTEDQLNRYTPIDADLIPSSELKDAISDCQRILKEFKDEFVNEKVKQNICVLFQAQVKYLISHHYTSEQIEIAIADAREELSAANKKITYDYEKLFSLDDRFHYYSKTRFYGIKDYFTQYLTVDMLNLFEFNYNKVVSKRPKYLKKAGLFPQPVNSKKRPNQWEESAAKKQVRAISILKSKQRNSSLAEPPLPPRVLVKIDEGHTKLGNR